MVNIFLVILTIILFVEVFRLYRFNKKNTQINLALYKREKEFQFLNFFLTDALSFNKPVEQAFPNYLNKLKETLNWTYHSIFRLDEEKQLLTIRFTGYLPDWYMKELSTKVFIKVGDASIGRAVATKQPATINVATDDPRFKTVKIYTIKPGYKSLSCYPITGKLKTHGGFCTYSEFENIFTLHDIEFFLSYSNLMGAVLEMQLLEKYLVAKNIILKPLTASQILESLQ